MNEPITKPSRINRRRKRRWRNAKIADLIKLGLTDCYRLAHNLTTPQHWGVGHSTPFVKGEKSPRQFAAFLCASYCAALCRLSIMVARSGQAKAWPVPLPGVENPLRAASRLFSTIGGGFILSKGATA